MRIEIQSVDNGYIVTQYSEDANTSPPNVPQAYSPPSVSVYTDGEDVVTEIARLLDVDTDTE